MAQATRTPGPGTTIEDANATELIASSAKAANVTASWKQVDRPGHVVAVATFGAISSDITQADIEIIGADDSSGTNPVSYGRFDTVAHTDDNKVVYLEAVIHKPYLAGVLTFARSGSGTATVGVKVHAIPHKGRSETRTA
mgnify:FL=1